MPWWIYDTSPADQYLNSQLAASGQATIDPFTGQTIPTGSTPTGSSTSTVPAAATPTGFNLSPTPTQGNGAFGLVPGQLGLPNPAGDLQAQIPGLAGLNANASGVINSYLRGQLPQDVQNAIQDASATYGVTSGMPGSGLQRNRTARDLGLTSLDLTGRGLSAYGPFVGAVSGTQTVRPELQSQIAEINAINRAAPSPAAAASHAEALYNRYLNSLARTGGGSRTAAPSRAASYGPSYGGAGGSYVPQTPSYQISSPALSYNQQGVPTTPYGTDYTGYGGGFDTFLNDALGVPDVGGYDSTPPIPFAPDYTGYGGYGYGGGGYDTILNDALGVPSVDPFSSGGWSEEDYYNWFGG